MSFFKIIGILVGLIFVAFAVTPMFLEDEYSTQRSTLIKAPVDVVFAQVNEVKNWTKWGPWMKDETMKVQYGEITEGLNASYSWTSKESGNGILTIASLEQNRSLNTNLNFDGSQANGFWTFEEQNDGVKVTWGFTGVANNYFERYLSLLIDTMAGGMFEEGLANLKEVAENALPTSEETEKTEEEETESTETD
jgi:hypothetical protein